MRPLQLLLISVAALHSFAQAAGPATGSVTGHVYCADTNAPARMVRVTVDPVRKSPASAASGVPAPSDLREGSIVQTGVDGSFLISNVVPGRYYVRAMAAGYLVQNPDRPERDRSNPSGGADQTPQAIPQVEVQADQTAAIDIRIQRGAAVSGTIRYDDGTPAAGIHVGLTHLSELKPARAKSDDVGVEGDVVTDDLGHYRISGVAAGKYAVQGALSQVDLVPGAKPGSTFSNVMRSVLIVYSGDAMRKNRAASFTLSLGEERTGEDITIPLGKLHSISGVVAAASDGHLVNSGNVELFSPEDKELVADAEIANDGTFHLGAVPEGSYTLRLHAVRDRTSHSSGGAGHGFTDREEPLKVQSDIPNLALTVGAR